MHQKNLSADYWLVTIRRSMLDGVARLQREIERLLAEGEKASSRHIAFLKGQRNALKETANVGDFAEAAREAEARLNK